MPLKYGLIEPADVSVPHLARPLEGLRIAHVSDPHIRAHRSRHHRLMNQLASMRLDLIVFTGDYMSTEGDEDQAVEVMARLTAPLRPKHGCFGVFGNHDTPELRERLADLPIHWLDDTAVQLPGLPLELFGMDMDAQRGPPDPVALLLGTDRDHAAAPMTGPDHQSLGRDGREDHTPLKILLCHYPQALMAASDLGMDLMISGHTHGGQIRLPNRRALVNSCDLPLRLTTGLLRHRDTQALVSRGLGEMALPLRVFCPPHVPVYTLRRRSMPGRYTDAIECMWRW